MFTLFRQTMIPCLSSLASTQSPVRLLSTSVSHDVRPFSEMPSPKGKFPILGHLYEMMKRKEVMKSIVFDEFFKELGPIYKLELPGKFNYCKPTEAFRMVHTYR